MPRCKNDPLEVRDDPNIVTDPVRAEEIRQDIVNKFRHIERSYKLGRDVFGTPNAFNEELSALKRQIDNNDYDQPMPSHIELRLVISHWAQKQVVSVNVV